MLGIDNIEIIVTISSLQPKSIEVRSIFDRGGYNGNSAIFRPSLVKRPSSSRAER